MWENIQEKTNEFPLSGYHRVLSISSGREVCSLKRNTCIDSRKWKWAEFQDRAFTREESTVCICKTNEYHQYPEVIESELYSASSAHTVQ